MQNVKLLLKDDIKVLALTNQNSRQMGCDVNVQMTKNGLFVVTKFFGKRGYTVAREIVYGDSSTRYLYFVYYSKNMRYNGYTYESLYFKTTRERDTFLKAIVGYNTKTVLAEGDYKTCGFGLNSA